MSIKESERLIQTFYHSNPATFIAGSLKINSSGDIMIDFSDVFGVIFVNKPVIVGLVYEGGNENTVFYQKEWIKDGKGQYTGLVVYCDGSGNELNVSLYGIVKFVQQQTEE